MPLYEYHCPKCNKDFEDFMTYAERNSTRCPQCNKRAIKKMSTCSVSVDSTVRDLRGERIWFPKNGKSYFDKALRRTFSSIKEKKAFMDQHKIVMDGSYDAPQNSVPAEAGADRTGNRVMIPTGGG